MKIVEEPTPSNEVEIYAEKLKFYKSQLKVWDYAKVSAAEFQKLSFDDRSTILKKCHVDMTTKYSAGSGNKFFYEAVSSGKSKPVFKNVREIGRMLFVLMFELFLAVFKP